MKSNKLFYMKKVSLDLTKIFCILLVLIEYIENIFTL